MWRARGIPQALAVSHERDEFSLARCFTPQIGLAFTQGRIEWSGKYQPLSG
jgi:hypothetical protein